MCCNGVNAALVLDDKEVVQSPLNRNLKISLSSTTNKTNQVSNKHIIPTEQISNDPLFTYKSVMICMFCGGKACKHEDFTLHKNPAIYGLNSDKIDDNIYASQRPANSLIEKYNLVSKFKELNIGLIVNLQLPGEHSICGPIDKLDESGFSYSPSLFESEGIHVLLCGWKDMNVPDSLNHMLNIVKEMYYYVHNLKKKILVHCHAGYGRTGIVIACFKIFDELISAEVAKFEIRQKRPKCIQTKPQLEFCLNFQEFIKRLRANFNLINKRNIENFLCNQNKLDVGNYYFNYTNYNKYVPLFLLYVFDAIIDLKKKNNIDEYSLYKCLGGSVELNENIEKYLKTVSKEINNYKWEILYINEDLIFLSELLYKWLQKSIEYVISRDNILKLNDDFSNYENVLKTCEIQTLNYIGKFLVMVHDDNNVILDEETKQQKYLFIEKLSNYLLGNLEVEKAFDSKESDELGKCIEKLKKLIVFFEDKNKLLNNNLNQINNIYTNDKDNMLVNVYNTLKDYFETKQPKNINISNSCMGGQVDSDTMFQNINKMLTGKNINLNVINNNYKINNFNNLSKETDLENESLSFLNNTTSRNFKISKLGTISRKINKLEDTNDLIIIKKGKMKFHISTSKNENENTCNIINNRDKIDKIIDEIEEEKKIPWIREEDC